MSSMRTSERKDHWGSCEIGRRQGCHRPYFTIDDEDVVRETNSATNCFVKSRKTRNNKLRSFHTHQQSYRTKFMKALNFLEILALLFLIDSRYRMVVHAQPSQFDLLNELPICQWHDEFVPELLHNTGSYGNMFEVRTKQYPVKVTEISFSTDLFTNVTFHVWTKTGTYENHESIEESWTKIAQGWTNGLGKMKPTPIPQEYFTSLWIEPQQTQAFIVMLETPDIRYNYGTIERSILVEHDDFLLLEGKSVAWFPPFESKTTFFSPRIFTGSMKYYVEKPCDDPSTIPSSAPSLLPSFIPTSSPPTALPSGVASSSPSIGIDIAKIDFRYLFVVEFDEVEFVSIELHDVTESTLNESFNNDGLEGDTALHEIIERGNLIFEGVTSSTVIDSDEYECNELDSMKMCVALECSVEISHNRKVSLLEVRYALLPFSEIIHNKLTFTKTEYIGPKPIDTVKPLRIHGVDYDAFEDESTIKYLENAVREFLASVQDQADIASVKVIAKHKVENTDKSPLFRRFLLAAVARSRSHIKQDTSSVDLTIAVTGEYLPPPEIDFGFITQDSFKNEGDALIEILKKGENENLKRITKVEPVEETSDVEETAPDVEVEKDVEVVETPIPPKGEKLKSTTIPIVIALSGVCIVSLFFVLVWGKSKNSSDDDEEEDGEFRSSSTNGRSIYNILLDRTKRESPEALNSDLYYRESGQF